MALRSTDRILVLEKISKDKDTTMLDQRVFTGENNLHAVMDPSTLMWSMKYDRGHVPAPLKAKFTEFRFLKQYADAYFKTKSIVIKEVID